MPLWKRKTASISNGDRFWLAPGAGLPAHVRTTDLEYDPAKGEITRRFELYKQDLSAGQWVLVDQWTKRIRLQQEEEQASAPGNAEEPSEEHPCVAHIEAEPRSAMRKVEFVEYHLVSSFPDPIRRAYDRGTGFALIDDPPGELCPMRAEPLDDTTPVIESVRIHFRDKSAARLLNVQGPLCSPIEIPPASAR